MRILNLKKVTETEAIKEAVSTLKSGGLVIYPTETMYGIGADATNQTAVNKLLTYKARREGKPLSIAVSSKKMAEKYVQLNAIAKNLYRNFLPGPVTVVSEGKHMVAQGVESELGTLGIRIPAYPLAIRIVETLNLPITATSANASYKKRPYSVEDILKNTSAKQQKLIDLVLDAGELPVREPSTVFDTTRDEPVVLRQGDVKFTKKSKKVTYGSEETQSLGEELIAQYKHYLGFKSVVFCLEGEMGVGKTQLTKGIAKALNIHKNVTSPTFILERVYPFIHGGKKRKLIHTDAWRILTTQEFLDLGFVRMIDEGSVIVVEWADRVIDAIKPYTDEAKMIWVHIAYTKKENERLVTWGDLPNNPKHTGSAKV